jgi:diaminopimelate epimerase
MKLDFYKYQGTGNDFVMIDNRKALFPKNNTSLINKLCDRKFGIGADGLILLENSDAFDFTMVYFNADGNEGSMCGNGGRCIVAFANQLNVIQESATFNAVDGLHYATFKDNIVSLQMIDINKIEVYDTYTFLNTGSPHHVEFLEGLDDLHVKVSGKKIRRGSPYFEEGTNVNFAEIVNENTIKVRTYERGVEDETLSCGTGVTAVAIAANFNKIITGNTVNIKAVGGDLSVSFEKQNGCYNNVILTGPANFVFQGQFKI